MAEPDDLTLGYLHRHPQEAARVLDTLAPADVAALWAALPARVAAPSAAAMRPGRAAQALLALPDEAAVALLAALPAAGAAALLRPLRSGRVRVWLAQLPTRQALACQALVQMPADAVGAVTDTDALAFAPDATVAQALQALQGAAAAQDLVLVEAAGGTGQGPSLLGGVPVGALLMAHPDDRLHRWCQPLAALPALMPAAAALAAPGWRDGLRRPVLQSDGRLLGLVSQQALLQVPAAPATAPAATALGWLAQGYWRAVAALCELAVQAWRPAPAAADAAGAAPPREMP